MSRPDPLAQIDRLPGRLEAAMGGIDLLVHCAGVGHFRLVDALVPTDAAHILDVNLHVRICLTQGAVVDLVGVPAFTVGVDWRSAGSVTRGARGIDTRFC